MGIFLNELWYHFNNIRYHKEFATVGGSSSSSKRSSEKYEDDEDILWTRAASAAVNLSSNVKTAISTLLDNEIAILAATSTAVKSLSLVYYTIFWIKDIENLSPRDFKDSSHKEFCNAIAELCGFSTMYEHYGKTILNPYSVDNDEFSIDGIFIIDLQQISSLINEDIKKAASEKMKFKVAASEAPNDEESSEDNGYTMEDNIIHPFRFVSDGDLTIELDEDGCPKSSSSSEPIDDKTGQKEIIISAIQSSNILRELFPDGYEVKYNPLYDCATLTVHDEDYKIDVINGSILTVTAPILNRNESVFCWIGTQLGKKILMNSNYYVTEEDLTYYANEGYSIVKSNIFTDDTIN